MKFLDTTTPITNILGEPITYREKADGDEKTLTLSHVLREALLTDFPNEKIGFAEAADRVDLAERLTESDLPVKIGNKEIEQLKTLVAKRWSILIAGRAVHLIDAAPDKPAALPAPEKADAA